MSRCRAAYSASILFFSFSTSSYFPNRICIVAISARYWAIMDSCPAASSLHSNVVSTNFALPPNSRVPCVSFLQDRMGFTVQITAVLDLPDKLCFRTFVSSLSRHGTCCPAPPPLLLKQSITRCKTSRDLLMLAVSLFEEDTPIRYVSEPARSTKFSVEYFTRPRFFSPVSDPATVQVSIWTRNTAWLREECACMLLMPTWRAASPSWRTLSNSFAERMTRLWTSGLKTNSPLCSLNAVVDRSFERSNTPSLYISM
mmetsp:Transcript_1602/g.3607  ORF Transcript_1602/g.3607 Transcript_1602/m.3607 type:complete len:256 (-) Transcript_1602:384-1151(-)